MRLTPSPVLAFLDTEYTNLDPAYSELTEIAVVLTEADTLEVLHKVSWFVGVSLHHADERSLAVQRFHERHPQGNLQQAPDEAALLEQHQVAGAVAHLTHGTHIMGLLPYNDTERLRTAMVNANRKPSWVHRLIDIEAYAAGALGLTPPWTSDSLGDAFDVPPQPDETRHTALGDALWSIELFRAARDYAQATR